MYVWSTEDIALGREAAEATRELRETAPTVSRCSKVSATGSLNLLLHVLSGLLLDFLGANQP